MIIYNSELKTFYLETENSSYVMRVLDNGTLMHVYYGAKISQDDVSYRNYFRDRSFSPSIVVEGKRTSMNIIPQEYPTFGRGDFRIPAVSVADKDGRRVNNLVYSSHKIVDGKPAIADMPQLDVNTENVQTLEITLVDNDSGFEVVLFYTTFDADDIIARHSTIKNIGNDTIKLHHADSVSLDFDTSDFEIITLHGSHIRERHVERYPLHHGITSVESRRGASSHQLNPFAALVAKNTTELLGDAYGVTLVYSADFKITAEMDQFRSVRLQAGVNPETFSWTLNSGETFTTPEALLTYSAQGLNKMSQNFHAVCRKHLGKCADKTIKHPIIINSWEAMYFDMNEEKIRNFVKEYKGLGIDTFVLDDGWFGHRDRDDSSLGDWFVDRRKFPDGLYGVIDACHENGLNFGIWFEPEMISRDSKLFEEHPDWCIHAGDRVPVEARQQLVLDMSRQEVVDEIYSRVAAILKEYDISYVKWDMNRHITDNGSDWLGADRQGEHAHRYILGVYQLMDRLVNDFPNVFFEGCSGGGGRFDFGMLYYMPQIWTSDDSDANERLKIQYGTSFVYPPSTMVAHVSACPNHQTGRVTPFETRGEVAQMCSYGYELNVGKLSEEERKQIPEQIARHHELEELVNEGTYFRLMSPFETRAAAWELVSADKNKAYAMIAFKTAEPHPVGEFLKLAGLDPQKVYTVKQLGIKLSGSTLMNAGIPVIQPFKDYPAQAFDLISEE